MSKRKRILLITFLIICGFGFVLYIFHEPPEPVYQGKPLTYWLEQLNARTALPGVMEFDEQAQAAIQHLGTRAIPTCLRLMKTRESRLRLKFASMLPTYWRKRLGVPDNAIYQYEVQHQGLLGAYGIIALGTEAQPTVPVISKLLKDKNPAVRYNAFVALGGLGPVASNALPSLINCLKDPDPQPLLRFYAIQSLGEIHHQPDLVIPLLISYLDSQDETLQDAALWSLGRFGLAAKAAFPRIVRLLNDSSDTVRMSATNALWAIDPEAATKAGLE